MQPNVPREYFGIELPLEEWLERNRSCTSQQDVLQKKVAPFPPVELMQNVSGVTNSADFASHGIDILRALAESSPKPFAEYTSILDFGCGCGRLARMFKGFRHCYVGCDIDARHVDWLKQNLNFVDAVLTQPRMALPFRSNEFDCVISISVFTHTTEDDHWNYLQELHRIAKPGARLFLTIHGQRALDRAQGEERIFHLPSVPRDALANAVSELGKGGYFFIKQNGHLTSDKYEYGITFISDVYIKERWKLPFYY